MRPQRGTAAFRHRRSIGESSSGRSSTDQSPAASTLAAFDIPAPHDRRRAPCLTARCACRRFLEADHELNRRPRSHASRTSLGGEWVTTFNTRCRLHFAGRAHRGPPALGAIDDVEQPSTASRRRQSLLAAQCRRCLRTRLWVTQSFGSAPAAGSTRTACRTVRPIATVPSVTDSEAVSVDHLSPRRSQRRQTPATGLADDEPFDRRSRRHLWTRDDQSIYCARSSPSPRSSMLASVAPPPRQCCRAEPVVAVCCRPW